MLVNTTELLPVWESLVGFTTAPRRAPLTRDGIGFPGPDSALSAAAMRSVTDLHTLIDWDNLYESLPTRTAADYVSGTYAKAAIVKSSGRLYQSLIDANTGATSDAAKWLPTDPLSIALRETRATATARLLQAVMRHDDLKPVPTTLMRPTPIYDGEGKASHSETKRGRFVGVKLMVKSPDTVLTLNSLSMQLTIVQDLDLYLFNDTDIEPVEVFTIPAGTYNNRESVLALSKTLFSGIGKAGVYYIGYYEDDLTGNAINRAVDLTGATNIGCSSCQAKQTTLRKLRAPYVQLQPIYVLEPTVGERWFPEDEVLTDADNYGIGMSLSVSCDLTRLLIDAKADVADALAYQWAVVLLESMAHSQTVNSAKERLMGEAQYALGMKSENPNGIRKQAEQAIDGLRLSLSGLSPVCLPPSSAGGGIRVTSQFAKRR